MLDETVLKSDLRDLFDVFIWERLTTAKQLLSKIDPSYIKKVERKSYLFKLIQERIQSPNGKQEVHNLIEDYIDKENALAESWAEASYIQGYKDCINSSGTIKVMLDALFSEVK